MSLFELGEIVSTMRIKEKMNSDVLFRVGVQQAFSLHSNGDWGDLSDDDRKMNDDALRENLQIVSSYNLGKERILIITEWDRSVTTILLPEEY